MAQQGLDNLGSTSMVKHSSIYFSSEMYKLDCDPKYSKYSQLQLRCSIITHDSNSGTMWHICVIWPFCLKDICYWLIGAPSIRVWLACIKFSWYPGFDPISLKSFSPPMYFILSFSSAYFVWLYPVFYT